MEISTGDLIIDIILGFIMINVYNFVTYNKLTDNGIFSIFYSFIIGYPFRIIMGMIPISFGIFDLVGIFIVAMLIAYGAGRIIQNPNIENIIDFLNIRRNLNNTIWIDLLDKKYTSKLRVSMPNGWVYIGYLYVAEEYTQTPVVSLYGYKIIDEKHSLTICDHSKIPNRVIILDTNKADSVEIIYGRNSEMTKLFEPFLKEDIEPLYEYKCEENNGMNSEE